MACPSRERLRPKLKRLFACTGPRPPRPPALGPGRGREITSVGQRRTASVCASICILAESNMNQTYATAHPLMTCAFVGQKQASTSQARPHAFSGLADPPAHRGSCSRTGLGGTGDAPVRGMLLPRPSAAAHTPSGRPVAPCLCRCGRRP